MLKFSSRIFSLSRFLISKLRLLWPEEFLEEPEEFELALPILDISLDLDSLLLAL